MTRTPVAFMPLATYPEGVADESIEAASGFAASLGCILFVTTYSVDLPQSSSALGNYLLNIPGLVRAAEEKSEADCERLKSVVEKAAGSHLNVNCTAQKLILGAALETAASRARYYDFALLPWSRESAAAQDMAQAVIFGSGRPTILVPPSTRPASLAHIAIAWDGSRVAARALCDALPLLAEEGLVSVLTVRDEKPLGETDPANALAFMLAKRGFNAHDLPGSFCTKRIDRNWLG